MEIQFSITKKTKTAVLAATMIQEVEVGDPIINEDRLNDILEHIPEVELPKHIINMSIAEFKEASQPAYLMEFLKEKYALQGFGKIKAYRREMKEIDNLFHLYSIERDKDEEAAMDGVNFLDMASSMVFELVKFFNLQSFQEGQQKTVADWLVIAKNNKANADYQSNLNERRKERMGNG